MRKRPFVVLLAALVLMFAALQLIRPERTNPPVDPSKRLDAHVEVPADVAAILDRSCRDCHTNETRWPWYSHVAPASLLLAYDVREARHEMNFSEWGTYDPEDAGELLEEICEMVEEGEMPLRPYTWLHRDAKLSSADVERLCEWSRRARAAMTPAAGPGPGPAQR